MTQPADHSESQPEQRPAPSRALLAPEALRGALPSGWQGDTSAIWREFHFDHYLDGVAFAQRVAQQAENADHHPDLLIGYKTVRVTYTTHDAGGVTALDVTEARSIRELV